MTHLSVGELGEAELLAKYIFPMLIYRDGRSHINGDDCAVIPISSDSSQVAFTIDCAPKPMFMAHTTEPDYYPYGWMSVLITYSDLLSMGAVEPGLLVSLELPPEMTIVALTKLLSGIQAASHHFRIPVVGGNVKDTSYLNVITSGYGFLPRNGGHLRSMAKAGDSVYMIGYNGYFVSSFLAKYKYNLSTEDKIFNEFFYLPSVQDVAFRRLLHNNHINAVMDSSDGPTGCLVDIARASKVDIILQTKLIPISPAVRKVAELEGIDPKVLAMTWGNWEFIFTSSDPRLDMTLRSLRAENVPIYKIGHVEAGAGHAYSENGSARVRLVDISSKRFDRTSSFTGGFGAYMTSLRQLVY